MDIYVGNLSYDTTDADFQSAFEAHGSVTSARVVMDKFTDRSRGFGFVEMADDSEADAAIKALKFRRKLFYAPAFAQLLRGFSDELPDDVDAVLPVPLHWRRKWWRGFNQALEIARPIANHLGLPLAHVARRHRATPPQSGLSAAAREKNLRRAFTVRRRVNYQHVLVIDDVVTTGATLTHLASELRENGIEKVSAMAVARSGAR